MALNIVITFPVQRMKREMIREMSTSLFPGKNS